MKVSSTTLSLSSLSLLQQRIIRTLRGAFIADAASMGLHWIYNPDDVIDKLNKSLHNSIKQPEFINPPIPNYYSTKEFPNHYLYGMLSPYGEQLLYITQYISSSIEKKSDEKTTPTLLDGNTMMNGLYEWGTTFGGRPDHALTTVISNIEAAKKEQQEGVSLYPNCGADDDQAHFYMKLIPVVCRYISETTTSTNNNDDDLLLLKNVEISIRIHQNNDIAVAFGIAATRIIQSILLSSTTSSSSTTTSNLLQILDTVYENLEIDLKKVFDNNTNMIDETKKDEIIQLVLQSYQRGKTAATEYTTLNDFLLILSNEKMKDQQDNPFYNLAARSCALPGSFIGPMYLFYKIALLNNTDSNIIDDNTYINAIRENILAAGDTCSRGIFIGAVLGAAMTVSSTTSTTTNENDTSDVVTFDTLWNKVEINTRNEIDLYSTKIAKVE